MSRPSFRFLIAALLLAGPGCGGDSEPAPVIRPVRTLEVYAAGASRTRTFSGVSRAGVESRLSFKVGGTVTRVAVDVGSAVRAGDLIAELDARDYRLKVSEAEAGFARAQSELRNAEANYERVRALYESRTASRQDLDAARTARESAEAQVKAFENTLELARLQVDYTRLTAPTAGSIAQVLVDANENVQPGAPVAVLNAGSRAEVTVNVPEQLILDVREGDAVIVTFAALAGAEFGAAVTEVGVASPGATTAFPVTVRLDADREDVRPGMAAEVAFRFEGTEARERFLLPPHAVLEDRNGRFVYVAAPADSGFGTVQRRDVTVGELTADGMEILDGLRDGDRVVTAGMSRIEEGLRVRLSGDGE